MGKVPSLVYCDRTDIGRRRSNNQDNKAVLPATGQQQRSRGWLFLVADGMGAHAAGELASAIAAERVPRIYEEQSQYSPPLALRNSIEQANGEIFTRGERSPEHRGMGTTCTTLVLHPRGAILGHVGDSRAYRIRGRKVEQLSRDHSLVWELETAGGMSREQAADAAPKNIITRSMGPHAHVDVDLEGPFPVQPGDVYVLCTDGLSGQVRDEEIGLFAAELEPADAVTALIGLALVRGAPDNVTVIAVRAGDEEATRTSRNEEPWPLSEQATSQQRQTHRAWISLGLAAAALLAALVFNPASMLMAEACGRSRAVYAACLFGSIFAVLAALIGLAIAFSGFISGGRSRGRVLGSGELLGRGPYRHYDATPTEQLVEGVLGSLDTAAQMLPVADRDRTNSILARARQLAAAGSFHEAVTAVAEAIAIHTRAVEDARRDETARATPAAHGPHRR